MTQASRLAVFADPRHIAVRLLLPVFLEALAQRADLRCAVLFVPPCPSGQRARLRWQRDRLTRRLQIMLGSGRWERSLDLAPLPLTDMAGRYRLELVQMPEGDPNHPEVLDYLRREPRVDLGVSLYCIRRFGAELLRCFDMVANYHNGHLPEFRGLRATNWSLYMGRPTSGYAFHRMTAEIDAGGVLCGGDVPVIPGETPADLELRKTEAASRHIPELLDMLSFRSEGRSQNSIACVHDRRAFELATRVDDPATLSRHEWESRLRAFLRVFARLDGRWWPVTAIAPCDGGGPLTFRSADGHWLRVSGIDFWPAALARYWVIARPAAGGIST